MMDHQNTLRFGSSSSGSTGATSHHQHQQQHHHHHHHHAAVGSYGDSDASGSIPSMQAFVNSMSEQAKQQQLHHEQQMLGHTNDAPAAAAALHANPLLTYYMSHTGPVSASLPSQTFSLYETPSASASLQHPPTTISLHKDSNVAVSQGAATDLNFRTTLSFSKPADPSTLDKAVKIKVQVPECHDMEPASMAMAAFAASAAAAVSNPSLDPASLESQKAKILAHPYFPRLLQAYANCHKIGAPPEVVATLDEVSEQYQSFRPPVPGSVGEDPELDEFMHVYSDKLQKHHDELTDSLEEARTFLKRMEIQLNTLSKDNQRIAEAGSNGKAGGPAQVAVGDSSEDDEEEGSCCDADYLNDMNNNIDPVAEDSQLKQQLLRKYSSYMICSLKKEFLKRKKKGKLPKEARQKLLDWWTQHYKWPYPSENEKAALAEVTGLNQKQINNWFINQRKRHWKPSEDLQYVMVDANDLPAIQFPNCNANL